MGLLDGLLSSLLSSAAHSAGSNIGNQLTGGISQQLQGGPSVLSNGRNMLQIGAALLGAGVIANELFQQPQAGRPATLPPPPPPPGAIAAPLPPLPPLPTGTTGNDTLSPIEIQIPRELTYAIARAMVAAALADGSLGSEEQQLLEKRLKQADLAPEQQRRLDLDLREPASPEELATLVLAPAQREALYRFAGLVILADRQVGPQERAWLDRLAAALAFDPAHRQSLEEQIFAALG